MHLLCLGTTLRATNDDTHNSNYKIKTFVPAKYGQGFDLALRYRNSLNSLCVPYTKNISMCKVVNVAGSK